MAGKNNFFITDTDKEWVHESFAWLIKSYGYPSPGFTPILFTEEFFPRSIAHRQTAIEPLLADLCDLFQIDPATISFEIEEDIRDTHGIPYEIHGQPFECDLELIKTESGYHYKFFFARSLLAAPKRLVFNAVFQFIQIGLSQVDIEWIGNEDQYFLFYLIGIYTGCGVILAQTMTDIGRHNDGHWERTWKYVSPMPIPIMAYGLALHTSMTEEKAPAWKNFLPADIRVQYESAIDMIGQNPNPVVNKQEKESNTLLDQGLEQVDKMNFDLAIETYQKALLLTSEVSLKALLYHNIGYALLLKGDFQKSITYFQKTLEIEPGIGYCHANLAFAFIMLGDTDTGKYYHALAYESGKEIEAYSYRNLALYHQKRGENKKARQYFQKAFDSITVPVDWLEYLFARFLFEEGEKEESLIYLQMAVDKGEPFATHWMNEINGTV